MGARLLAGLRGAKLGRALALAGLALAGPAMAAANTPVVPSAAPAALLPVAGNPAVATFYDSWHHPRIWLKAGTGDPAAAQLVTILRKSQAEGFASGADLAAQVEAALTVAQSGTAADMDRAERTMSDAWVRFAAFLRSPAPGVEYAEAWLKPRPVSRSRYCSTRCALRTSARI